MLHETTFLWMQHALNLCVTNSCDLTRVCVCVCVSIWMWTCSFSCEGSSCLVLRRNVPYRCVWICREHSRCAFLLERSLRTNREITETSHIVCSVRPEVSVTHTSNTLTLFYPYVTIQQSKSQERGLALVCCETRLEARRQKAEETWLHEP